MSPPSVLNSAGRPSECVETGRWEAASDDLVLLAFVSLPTSVASGGDGVRVFEGGLGCLSEGTGIVAVLGDGCIDFGVAGSRYVAYQRYSRKRI